MQQCSYMEKKSFNQEDLIPVKWQYTIYNNSTNNFYVSQIVFLKSNPEMRLTVIDLDQTNNRVIVCTKNSNDGIDFAPECLLDYKEASFKSTKSKLFGVINISIN